MRVLNLYGLLAETFAQDIGPFMCFCSLKMGLREILSKYLLFLQNLQFTAGKRNWQKFLHTHHLYRSSTYEKRFKIFAQATELRGSQAVTNAKSMLAVSLAKQLCLLERQLKVYRDRAEALFREHPDNDVFGFLPGIGEKPRLLANSCKVSDSNVLTKSEAQIANVNSFAAMARISNRRYLTISLIPDVNRIR